MIVLLENLNIRVYNNQWQIRAEGGEICIIDRTIAGVSRPSHEAMAVIPTTVEFVHCELDAIYSEDLLRCHTGSPLDQFVSQSHRYRRSSSSRALFSNPRRAVARDATDTTLLPPSGPLLPSKLRLLCNRRSHWSAVHVKTHSIKSSVTWIH